MPNTVESFADVTEDSTNLFASIKCLTECLVEICQLINSRVARNKEQKGIESSVDKSRSIRLLRPLGPDALPTVNVFKTDSTPSREHKIVFSCELSDAETGRSGRTAFCLFKNV